MGGMADFGKAPRALTVVRFGLAACAAAALISACALSKLELVDTLCREGSAGCNGAGVVPNGNTSGAGGAGGASPGPGDPDAGPLTAPPDKLDLLFMIDNSISMRDKQDILRLANAN